ncbi:hypothetical protein OHA40_08525 [Nocardia sp. NBC_00508]|uniref:hypothetical protein n=1 Tax=Nocardia sp. NBC_00508 TaxID=2975992 RepID=UPI002E80B81F|nr:hypothetical protein [Nocardia sp. NBC_00508]WUD68148.1 hypothetical protein OHA40_08525 [Nocardia sp. NBC_00508]
MRVRFGDRLWRRRIGWLLLIVFVLFVFPGLLGAVATAQYQAASAGTSEIDGLSWMNIRDSSGVPLSSYTFATDRGGPLNPGATILWAILGLEFIGYMAIVTSAIWLIGYALSFRWMDWFAAALRGVADALTGQIATPIMLVTAAAIGAFFVAWFIVRGYHAKAAMQVVTMVGVGILGPVFLADPLSEVLSSHGLLAQGRDLGLSVAAGLNGNSSPNPSQLLATMQENLADNFARRPVQVWNFGHVVDENPSCRAAWTAGMRAGDDDRVKNGMKVCGDAAAHAKASDPTMGQVGTGLLLLLCGGILLVFAVFLGVKVIKTAMDAIYHCFMTIFGFAAGGFVYGPTQTFLVRNIVDGFIAAARMAAFTIFLGVYVLFLGNLFQQAHGQVMAVIIIAGAVEVIAISQLRRLNLSLSSGNNWMANRFASAIQGPPRAGGGGGGGGGGPALGMGGAQAASSLRGGLVAGMSALNTINASPVTAWALGATMSPLNPLSRRKKRMDLNNIAVSPMLRQLHEYNHSGRENWRLKAAGRLTGIPGGIRAALGVGNVLDGLGDSKVPDSMLAPTLRAMGATHEQVIDAQRAVAVQKASMKDFNPLGSAPLQKALAAGYAVENHQNVGRALPAFAAQAVVAADNLVRHSTAPMNAVSNNHQFVRRVMGVVDDEQQLRTITPAQWASAGRDVRQHIGRRLALEHQGAATAYYNNQNDPVLLQALQRSNRRLANFNNFDPNGGLNPWSS